MLQTFIVLTSIKNPIIHLTSEWCLLGHPWPPLGHKTLSHLRTLRAAVSFQRRRKYKRTAVKCVAILSGSRVLSGNYGSDRLAVKICEQVNPHDGLCEVKSIGRTEGVVFTTTCYHGTRWRWVSIPSVVQIYPNSRYLLIGYYIIWRLFYSKPVASHFPPARLT